MKHFDNKRKNSIDLEEDDTKETMQTESNDSKIFPQKLMEILTDPANSEAITWHPDGKVFMIISRHMFETLVLPKYFRKTKYSSFTRKLNRWNFIRVTRGREPIAYRHEFFQRDNEALCTQMYCNNDRSKFAILKSIKKKKISKSEPNPAIGNSLVEPTRKGFPSNNHFAINSSLIEEERERNLRNRHLSINEEGMANEVSSMLFNWSDYDAELKFRERSLRLKEMELQRNHLAQALEKQNQMAQTLLENSVLGYQPQPNILTQEQYLSQRAGLLRLQISTLIRQPERIPNDGHFRASAA